MRNKMKDNTTMNENTNAKKLSLIAFSGDFDRLTAAFTWPQGLLRWAMRSICSSHSGVSTP